MALKLTGKSTERELPPEGTHQGILYAIYDLGIQTVEQKGKEVKRPQVLISFELPHERSKSDKPLTISKRYTKSIHEKASLRKDIEGMLGRKLSTEEIEIFDMKKLLKLNCQLQIMHITKGERTYANITGIIALAKGMQELDSENTVIYYEIEDQVPEETPQWIENLIAQSEEWTGSDPPEPF